MIRLSHEIWNIGFDKDNGATVGNIGNFVSQDEAQSFIDAFGEFGQSMTIDFSPEYLTHIVTMTGQHVRYNTTLGEERIVLAGSDWSIEFAMVMEFEAYTYVELWGRADDPELTARLEELEFRVVSEE